MGENVRVDQDLLQQLAASRSRIAELEAERGGPEQLIREYHHLDELVDQLQRRIEWLSELRSQRDFLENLVDHAPLGIAVVRGPEFRYVLANPVYRSFWGSRDAPLIGRPLAEVFPEVVEAYGSDKLSEILETGKLDHVRELRIAPMGKRAETWWNIDRIPLKDERGQVDAVLVLVEDVTEQVLARHRIEEMAAAAEVNFVKLQAVISSISEGILIADPEGDVLSMNPAALHTGGYETFDEALENLRHRWELLEFHDEEGQLLPLDRWPMARVRRGETFSGWELHVHHKDRGRSWYGSFGGVPVYDRQGQLQLIVVTFHDISQRKRTERALRDSEQRFRASVESMLDGFAVLSSVRDDAGQIVDFRFDYVNEAGCLLNRRPRDEQVGRGLLELFPHFRDSGLFDELVRVVDTGVPLVHEAEQCQIRGATGEQQRIFDFRANKLNDGVAIVWRDVTHRKRMEQQLHDLNQTLEARVAERSAVAEQRAEQLRRLAGELTRTEDRERVRLARILHDHLQQLLVGAKFSAGTLRARLRDEGLRGSLQQVVDLLEESIEASRSLTVELSPPILHQGSLPRALHWLARWMREKHGLVTEVRADERANPADEETRGLLFQAVRELLLNVVKHARVQRAIVEAHLADDEQVRVVVADMGIGFDPDRAARQRETAGGFGLFSLQERLGLLGGKMTIDSAPGQGTRVALLAPLRLRRSEAAAAPAAEPPGIAPVEAAEAAAAIAEPPAAGGRGDGVIRVLLADDHDVVRNGLARLLQSQSGIRVVAQASDGQMAVDLARHVRPDVVVMDVSMPRMDGVEATRRIVAEMPEVKVVGLSMHGEGAVGEQMREAGAVTYLAKSSAPDDLVAAVRACKPARTG